MRLRGGMIDARGLFASTTRTGIRTLMSTRSAMSPSNAIATRATAVTCVHSRNGASLIGESRVSRLRGRPSVAAPRQLKWCAPSVARVDDRPRAAHPADSSRNPGPHVRIFCRDSVPRPSSRRPPPRLPSPGGRGRDDTGRALEEAGSRGEKTCATRCSTSVGAGKRTQCSWTRHVAGGTGPGAPWARSAPDPDVGGGLGSSTFGGQHPVTVTG
jgi:hypothetical protein